jgi:hypothetical protein
LAIKYLITNRRETALTAYEAAVAAADAVEDHPSSYVREQIFRTLADAVDEVLVIAASTLRDVRHKLEVYWGDLDDDDYGNDWKRIVLGDLMRLYMLECGLSWDEASGKMDLPKVQADWTAAAADYDRYVAHIGEDRLASSVANATALAGDAEERLLSIPAPDVSAVIKKLTTLWSDERFDPVRTSAGHAQILRDLRRLGSTP